MTFASWISEHTARRRQGVSLTADLLRGALRLFR